MPHSPRTDRRSARHRLAAAVVALAVVAGLVVLPAPALASWLDGCAEAAAGEIRVGLVVDFGTEPGAPGGVEVACVIVAEGEPASKVIVEWARTRGGTRWEGLLCGIAGYPASGCGERTDDGYLYWSYWMGEGGRWTHAGMGPGYRPASSDVIEGWRFQRGAGNPSDPPPRRDASPVCPPAPAPAPVPPPAPAPPPAPVAPGPAPAPSVATIPGVDDRRADVPAPTTGPVPAPDVDTADEAPGGGPEDGSPGGAPDGTGEADEVAEGRDGDEGATDEDVEIVDGTELAAGGSGGSGGAGAPPVGLVAVVGLALALGGGAAVRFRRTG